MTGNNNDAIQYFKKAVSINPNYAEANNFLGYEHALHGNVEMAVFHYKKAIQIDPNYARAYSNLSLVYLEQKNYTQAIEYFDKARMLGFINPDLATALERYR